MSWSALEILTKNGFFKDQYEYTGLQSTVILGSVKMWILGSCLALTKTGDIFTISMHKFSKTNIPKGRETVGKSGD